MDYLWSNSSYTSEFIGQNIQLSISNEYDILLFNFLTSTGALYTLCSFIPVMGSYTKAGYAVLPYHFLSHSSGWIPVYTRIIQLHTQGSIYISDSVEYESNQVNNHLLIPYNLIGIKIGK